MDIAQLADRLTAETAKIIYGKETQIRLIVMALLSQGHVLLEDLPGVGKTTLIKTLAAVSGCRSKRIQFVPDLLPADILGMNIYDRNRGEFRRLPGPVFTNLLLADEINRAVPRTQSALLEAMEERQVTIDGETLPLPTPFVVMATQNPVESESTFRLPAAQMDRFLIRLSMGYPAPEEERRMLFSLGDSIPLDGLETVTSPEELVSAQDSLSQIRVSPEVADYLVALVGATRSHPMVRMGASPRASRALFRAARAWAAMAGRSFVTPDDIQALIHPVLAHRLLLTNEARLSGVTADGVLDQIAAQLPVPPAAGDEFHGAKGPVRPGLQPADLFPCPGAVRGRGPAGPAPGQRRGGGGMPVLPPAGAGRPVVGEQSHTRRLHPGGVPPPPALSRAADPAHLPSGEREGSAADLAGAVPKRPGGGVPHPGRCL